jgi:hypothetical protein
MTALPVEGVDFIASWGCGVIKSGVRTDVNSERIFQHVARIPVLLIVITVVLYVRVVMGFPEPKVGFTSGWPEAELVHPSEDSMFDGAVECFASSRVIVAILNYTHLLAVAPLPYRPRLPWVRKFLVPTDFE